MVRIISKNKTHTTIKVSNRVLSSMSRGNVANTKRKLSSDREYIESSEEKIEIEKIKAEFEKGKFLTLKEFLLEN